MVNSFLVRFLILLWPSLLGAKVLDIAHTQGYLGEKDLPQYSERYQPLVFLDLYQGKLSFEDEIFFQDYFQKYIFPSEKDLSFFLRSELGAGFTCSNELLSEHFDEMRYAYRLVTLSYLIEAQSHMHSLNQHLRLKKGCDFDLNAWAKTCSPQTTDMKKFIQRLMAHKPKYDEKLPEKYSKSDWLKEFSKPISYSQYKIKSLTPKVTESDLPVKFKQVCDSNLEAMSLICNETDELYGLSQERDAYYLIGLSNIINNFNKKGEALGCLRRFAEVMSHKEVKYRSLDQLFPPLQNQLRQKYNERFLQGRPFLFGSSKEFEDKGIKDLYVEDQSLKVEPMPTKTEPTAPVVTKVEPRPESKKVVVPKPAPIPEPKKEFVEIRRPVKSAFLLASEVRTAQNMDRVEVDMNKLKYDYVFSLNMLNQLSDKLKVFMTREALTEMMTYDKLGTKEGPVPLLFIKFMIDYQEHQGLWNMLSVLGDKFYVSNEIDVAYKTQPEFIQLLNNDSTQRQWQIYIISPQ